MERCYEWSGCRQRAVIGRIRRTETKQWQWQEKDKTMAFKKREKSNAVDTAQTRLAAMKEIDKAQGAPVNYGTDKEPCTVVTLDAQIQAVTDNIEEYNGLLAQADNLGNVIEQGEKDLNDASARVLLGAQAKFGRDGSEVEQLGGTRQSERAKKSPKTAATPAK
jgi:hypothetical protein